jgi:tRNA(Ile)-lysidine synthase
VRPLLGVARAELEAFAKTERIEHREDSSNQTLDFERNRVRKQLLPIIAEVAQRDYRQPMLRTMETLSAEANFLRAVARKWLKKPTPFQALHVALQRRVLQEQMFDLGISPDFELIETLRSRADEKVCIRPNVSLVRKKNGLLELVEETELTTNTGDQELSFQETSGEVTFGGVEISWMIIASAKGYRPRAENIEVFDADSVGTLGRLRHWRAGDRFQPIGAKQSSKLQDLFTNAKVPASQRRQRILAEAANGQLFWVEGLRISELFKVTPDTKRLLVWQWKRLPTA